MHDELQFGIHAAPSLAPPPFVMVGLYCKYCYNGSHFYFTFVPRPSPIFLLLFFNCIQYTRKWMSGKIYSMQSEEQRKKNELQFGIHAAPSLAPPPFVMVGLYCKYCYNGSNFYFTFVPRPSPIFFCCCSSIAFSTHESG